MEKSNKKICLIYNYAQHYRTEIFKLIDNEFNCDFVFGDKYLDVKKMNYNLLHGNVTEVKNIEFNNFYFQKGVLSFFLKKYDTYLVLGEPRCVSTWLLLIMSLFCPHKRIFLWSHGWYGKETFIKRNVGKIFNALSSGAFIYNNRSRNLMIKGGMNKDKLHVIFNSLDYDTQLQLRNNIKQTTIYNDYFSNNNRVIVFIGRLTAVKRLDLLVEAISKLNEKGEQFNLVFIGNGEKKQEIENLIIDYYLVNNTWFYGACYDEEKNAELIYNADICVSPGNVGLTAIHSLMFGTPVITHNCFKYQMPEFEAIQIGKTGDFFEYNNVNSLVQTISKWFNDKIDKREEVRQVCYNEIDSKWNPHYQINIFKKVLEQNN